MNTTEAIEAALKGETSDVVIYWDSQDSNNEGPAFRRESTQESGALEFRGWIGENTNGYFLGEYFKGPDSAYLGPDSDGVYPNLIEA